MRAWASINQIWKASYAYGGWRIRRPACALITKPS
jgi:hypothetical protein